MSRRSGAAPGRAPGLVVDVDTGDERVPLGRVRVEELARAVLRAERVRSALVSVSFVSRAAIARLNRRHLGHAGATDVISFAMRDTAVELVIGDIYIAPAVARENARGRDAGVREEIARLVVHGVLHVLGYEHSDGQDPERTAMWRRQEKLVDRLYRRAAA